MKNGSVLSAESLLVEAQTLERMVRGLVYELDELAAGLGAERRRWLVRTPERKTGKVAKAAVVASLCLGCYLLGRPGPDAIGGMKAAAVLADRRCHEGASDDIRWAWRMYGDMTQKMIALEVNHAKSSVGRNLRSEGERRYAHPYYGGGYYYSTERRLSRAESPIADGSN